jgi:hypothetical protein
MAKKELKIIKNLAPSTLFVKGNSSHLERKKTQKSKQNVVQVHLAYKFYFVYKLRNYFKFFVLLKIMQYGFLNLASRKIVVFKMNVFMVFWPIILYFD